MIDRTEQFFDLLAGFKESSAEFVSYNSLTKSIELSDFIFTRSHATHLLLTKCFATLLHLAEHISSFLILVEKANASLGGCHLLTCSKGSGKLLSKLNKFWAKRCLVHEGTNLAQLHEASNARLRQSSNILT